jgi:hypothetical protein
LPTRQVNHHAYLSLDILQAQPRPNLCSHAYRRCTLVLPLAHCKRSRARTVAPTISSFGSEQAWRILQAQSSPLRCFHILPSGSGDRSLLIASAAAPEPVLLRTWSGGKCQMVFASSAESHPLLPPITVYHHFVTLVHYKLNRAAIQCFHLGTAVRVRDVRGYCKLSRAWCSPTRSISDCCCSGSSILQAQPRSIRCSHCHQCVCRGCSQSIASAAAPHPVFPQLLATCY